jgi:4-hydroxyproline epimerase
MQSIKIIDSHTGGEPTRMVVDGFPDLGPGTMAERRERFRNSYDAWRQACILEPRGHDVVVGALLCPPVSEQATAGVIFFNNAGYLGMCGHGLIGVIVSLAYLGRIGPGLHHIDTPVGPIAARLHEDGSVSIRNVAAYRYRHDVSVEVPGYGLVKGDIAWGGNWFFLIEDHGQQITADHIDALTEYTWAVRQAMENAGIFGDAGSVIDHIELFAEEEDGTHRNFVLCPGKAYDRSPCGTGTSAKAACLAADGRLAPGEVWRQTSIIGSHFDVHYEMVERQLIPTLRGKAHVSGENTLLLDPDDPFCWGIAP